MNNLKKGVYNPNENFMSSWRKGGHVISLINFMKQRYGVTPKEYTISIASDEFMGSYIKFEGKHDLAHNAVKNVRIPIRPIAVGDFTPKSLSFILKTTNIWKFEHCYTRSEEGKTVIYRSTNVKPIYMAVLSTTKALSFIELYNINVPYGIV